MSKATNTASACVLFRVDASVKIGSGHVARCLTLADEFVLAGCRADFVCRNHSGHLAGWIESRGHRVSLLETPTTIGPTTNMNLVHAAWLGVPALMDAAQTIEAMIESHYHLLVIDHYGIDIAWEQQLRPYASKVMVVDDLADRVHDTDLLLDQNFRINGELRYDSLVPTSCEKLLGPRYALLRREFAVARAKAGSITRDRPNMMIFMGGMDEHNVTTRVLNALESHDLDRGLTIHVVIGGSNPHRDVVAATCMRMNHRPGCEVKLHCQVDDMAGLMSSIDFAITAGGSNTWERCCLGVPTAILSVADNQTMVAKELDEFGVAYFVGCHHEISDDALGNSFAKFIESTELHESLRRHSLELVDGLGARRAMSKIMPAAARRTA